MCDIAWLLSRYNDAIIARTFSHETVEELAAAATIPVVNALTDKLHPCQILADAYTMHERGLLRDGVRVAFVGDGNNVAQSWIELARLLPIDLMVACPEGYDPDPAIVRASSVDAAGRVTIVRDPREAVAGASVVYTDVWTSMGQEAEKQARLRDFQGYQVNDALMKLAKKDAVILHCLPAHYGEEIDYGTSRTPNSALIDQAENRLHAQKALMVTLAG